MKLDLAFTIDGETYIGAKAAREAVENDLGSLIDRMNKRKYLDGSTKLVILDWLISEREDLKKHLSRLDQLSALVEELKEDL